ncbi:MAG: hypothetical protein QGI24_03750, partial [Kiritimatiellia bacterium]|nr:hypothetical protein [Kiritimatiellia bacterium]
MKRMLGVISLVCTVTIVSGCFPWRSPERVRKYMSMDEALADKETVEFLDLSAGSMTNWPNGLQDFPSLVKLSLRNVKLPELDEGIGNLRGLVWLDLANMGISSLPESVGGLSAVTTLYLGD